MAATLCKCIGDLCQNVCSACGKVCSAPCRVVSAICKPLCDVTGNVCRSHFCLYVTVTLGLNVPPVVWAAEALHGGGGDCGGSRWLLIEMMLCLIHIAAAFYLAVKTTTFGDTIEVLCYDPWIAVYIVVCIFFFYWLCSGVAKGDDMNEGGDCPETIEELVWQSIYCGFAFFSVGCTVMAISLCASLCRRGSWREKRHTSDPYAPPYVASI